MSFGHESPEIAIRQVSEWGVARRGAPPRTDAGARYMTTLLTISRVGLELQEEVACGWSYHT